MPHPLTPDDDGKPAPSPEPPYGRIRLCICHGAPERPRDSDLIEACPACGEMRLARPAAQVGNVVAVRVSTNLDGDGKHIEQSVAATISGALRQTAVEAALREMKASKPDMLVLPPALEDCARQILAPEKCPVCQGRYPDAAAEGAFRDEVAAEAFNDARDDLAEALGRVVDEHDGLDSFEDLLVEVRELREAHNACLDRAPQARAEALAAAREEGRRQGLRDAAEYIQNVAAGLARDVVDPPLHAAKPRHGWGHRLAMANHLADTILSHAKAAK